MDGTQHRIASRNEIKMKSNDIKLYFIFAELFAMAMCSDWRASIWCWYTLLVFLMVLYHVANDTLTSWIDDFYRYIVIIKLNLLTELVNKHQADTYRIRTKKTKSASTTEIIFNWFRNDEYLHVFICHVNQTIEDLSI